MKDTCRLLQKCTLALLLLIGTLVLSGCFSRNVEAEDPYIRYRPAMKPAFQDDFDQLNGAPRYDITFTLDTEEDRLDGFANVRVQNTSADAWPILVFRLYPVLVQYGGSMVIKSVFVDGENTAFVYDTENTAIRVSLPQPLDPYAEISVGLSWQLEFPTWSNTPGTYKLFGRSQEMISLPLFYPSLAVYEPIQDTGIGEWWREMGNIRGDAAYNLASLFVVTATLPSGQVPVTSGTLVSSTIAGPDQTQYVWVTGPSREFLLHTSTEFSTTSIEAYGTRVTSYWLPGHEATGRLALKHAAASLRIYSDYYGDYPFRDMKVAPAPLSFRGMEYPQVNLLGIELYDRFRINLEILVAHEVAHQWWYQMVHNDPVNTPWLDEALAEYSIKLYFEALRGQQRADNLQNNRWEVPLVVLREKEEDAIIDQPVSGFLNGGQYETVIYGKGALLYSQIHEILGNRRFKAFIQDYLQRYKYKIIYTEDWAEFMRELDEPEINKLYGEWVENRLYKEPVEPATAPLELDAAGSP